MTIDIEFVGRENDTAKEIIFATEAEAKAWEKAGHGYVFPRLTKEARSRPPKQNVYVDVPRKQIDNVLMSLCNFSGGQVSPHEIEVLLKATKDGSINTV